MATRPEPFFLNVDAGSLGQRFALYHAPQQGAARGLVVYVHPFAEEMNKSRRMAAIQSRSLAAAGFAVLQMDLLGCGDSAGDFGDATWEQWVADVVHACHWLTGRHRNTTSGGGAIPPLWLWGLRAGCLLAAEAGRRLDEPCNFLFWQPAIAGKLVLHQFLRIAATRDLLSGGTKGSSEALRRELAAGRPVEIAGYSLCPALASGLERAQLQPPIGSASSTVWIEVSSDATETLTAASATLVSKWTHLGHEVHTSQVSGPMFWQTSEVEEAPQLIVATLAALECRVAA